MLKRTEELHNGVFSFMNTRYQAKQALGIPILASHLSPLTDYESDFLPYVRTLKYYTVKSDFPLDSQMSVKYWFHKPFL